MNYEYEQMHSAITINMPPFGGIKMLVQILKIYLCSHGSNVQTRSMFYVTQKIFKAFETICLGFKILYRMMPCPGVI